MNLWHVNFSTAFGIMIQIFNAMVLAVLVCTTTANTDSPDVGVKSPSTTVQNACAGGINAAAQTYGKYFGTATKAFELEDQGYSRLINNWANFGQITPAFGMKVSILEIRLLRIY
jgi:hypothetical protein